MTASTPQTIASDYRARFRRVLEYIDANVAGDLSVHALARTAHYSKYHFHRQFSALLGVSVYDYVQLVRLTRAALQLGLYPFRSVLDAALDHGYESPEAFSRAFKKLLGSTPSAFQSTPDWQAWGERHRHLQTIRNSYLDQVYRPDDIKTVQFPDTQVGLLEHRGDPARVQESVRRFIDWRRQAGLPPSKSATFNIFYHDPHTTPPEEYRLGLCVATTRDVSDNAFGVTNSVIPAGRCAVLRHTGPDPLEAPIHYLYATWLPNSGETPRDFPLFAQRVVLWPPQDAITDIFLPIY